MGTRHPEIRYCVARSFDSRTQLGVLDDSIAIAKLQCIVCGTDCADDENKVTIWKHLCPKYFHQRTEKRSSLSFRSLSGCRSIKLRVYQSLWSVLFMVLSRSIRPIKSLGSKVSAQCTVPKDQSRADTGRLPCIGSVFRQPFSVSGSLFWICNGYFLRSR